MKVVRFSFGLLFLSVAAFLSGLPIEIGLPIAFFFSLLWAFSAPRLMRSISLLALSAGCGGLMAYLLAQATGAGGLALGLIRLISFAFALMSISWLFDLLQNRNQTIHFIADLDALCDPRIVELAASGLFDETLAINLPALKNNREAMAHLKKLEQMPHLGLTLIESDLPLHKLCQTYRAKWLTSGNSKLEKKAGLAIVDIDLVAGRLQPLRREGESLEIKIQRPGKEEGQGIGYLEDGSMVVINGAGDFIGCTIIAEVLSTKQTAAGRIIFCNLKSCPEPEMSA